MAGFLFSVPHGSRFYVAVGTDRRVDISSSITAVPSRASSLLFTPESQYDMFPFPHSSPRAKPLNKEPLLFRRLFSVQLSDQRFSGSGFRHLVKRDS